jgi:hypothetical protein
VQFTEPWIEFQEISSLQREVCPISSKCNASSVLAASSLSWRRVFPTVSVATRLEPYCTAKLESFMVSILSLAVVI